MAAAHERDDDGGDEDGGAEHHQVVLEAHEHRRDCSRSARNDKRFRQSQPNGPSTHRPALSARGGGPVAIKAKPSKANKTKW